MQLFEGCLTLDAHDKDLFSSDKREAITKRRVIAAEKKRWLDSRIPYEIVNIGITSTDQGEYEHVIQVVTFLFLFQDGNKQELSIR